MATSKNPAAKSRKADSPYLTITLGSWTWKVLKFSQADGTKPYGRAFCAVSSPDTFGGADLGDVYVSDLRDALKRGGIIAGVSGLDADDLGTLLGLGPALTTALLVRSVRLGGDIGSAAN